MNTTLGHQSHAAVDALLDRPRLLTQYERIMGCMSDGRWHTQYEISAATGDPQGSVGSQLRNARVDGRNVEKRRRGDSGTWEYRLVSELRQGGVDMRRFTNDYNTDGKEKRREARERAGNKCIRCGSPSVPGRILTTHHFDGDKSNDAWWNLLALCQVCHLQIQAKVDPEQPWFLEHSEWLKPFVAGFYAKKYEGRMIAREEAEQRLTTLLAYELRST